MTNEERQQAIEWLKRRPVMMAGAKKMYALAIEALEAYVPDMNVGKWIPCSERLPEEGHDVLITKEPLKIKGYEQKVIKAKRSVDPRSGKVEWWSPELGTLADKEVLAWTPLPEPWREEQKGSAT